MNNQYKKEIKKWYQSIVNSIAFYPALISIALFILSLFLVELKNSGFATSLKETVPWIKIYSEEAARVILGTIVGGMISLTVFSFSMVMIVLNMASANFSPRILPGLITKRFHQVVLGFYLGTIIYSLILLINIRSPKLNQSIPSIGVLFSVLLALICLSLFVYFIHSISTSIQIEKVLQNIYRNTRKRILKEATTNTENNKAIKDSREEWYPFYSEESGFLKEIVKEPFVKLAKQNDFKARILVPFNSYVYLGDSFMETSKNISEDKDLHKKVQELCLFYEEEISNADYEIGIKHIKEIAVKALSPGINDPGTAKKAIHYLTDLLILKMDYTPYETITDHDGNPRLELKKKDQQELLYTSFIEILEFGITNPLIAENLLLSMEKLTREAHNKGADLSIFENFTDTIIEKCKLKTCSIEEKKRVNKLIQLLNDRKKGNPFPEL